MKEYTVVERAIWLTCFVYISPLCVKWSWRWHGNGTGPAETRLLDPQPGLDLWTLNTSGHQTVGVAPEPSHCAIPWHSFGIV
jgi:hypothetical protein